MSVEAWVTLVIAIVSGFGVWMFRIDRICTRLESKIDENHDWRDATTNRLSAHADKLDEHGTRITRIETRLEPK